MSEAGKSASSGVLFTDQDEGQADDEGEDVRTQRLFVLPVAFGKHMHPRVDLILAQGLQNIHQHSNRQHEEQNELSMKHWLQSDAFVQ